MGPGSGGQRVRPRARKGISYSWYNMAHFHWLLFSPVNRRTIPTPSQVLLIL